MERTEALLESLLERGMLKAEPDPAQPDIREHGVRDKGGRSCVACHEASVECEGADDHRQRPHRTRTTPVRTER